MNQNEHKQKAAEHALTFIEDNTIVGIGTGSTVNYFIDALASMKGRIEGTVASSEASTERLKSHGIPVFDLNTVGPVPIYVDGTDEFNRHLQLTKGGGGALTREKIIAAVAQKFVRIADESKRCDMLGQFPIPVEVIPMARSYVAREIVKLGGNPVYRDGFVTDNGNIILDIHDLQIDKPMEMESTLSQIVGVVCNGLFAKRGADVILVGSDAGIETVS